MMDNNHPTAVSQVGGSIDANMLSAASTGPSNSGDTQPSDTGWSLDPTDIPSDRYVQHYRQVQSPVWDGGPYIFDGQHNDFCFVCGSSMELFECQTCSTSYHASCMSPSLDPGDVPDFWFCPHCVARELHLPQPTPATYFSPPPPLTPSTSPSDVSRSKNSSAHAAPPHRRMYEDTSKAPSHNIPSLNTIIVVDPKPLTSSDKLAPPPTTVTSADAVNQHTSKTGKAKGNTSRPRRSYSPPRKKSKYSAFSSEVDKALAVIHKELEATAQVGKAESELRDKIQMLEQELRLKDGQITLASRELELAKRSGGDAAGLKAENQQLKAHVSRLNGLLEGKDAELRDWRERLKSMIGE